MINHWIITGDTHGLNALRIKNIKLNCNITNLKETGIIILGDAGFNYSFDIGDKRAKEFANNEDIPIYCVRGNHEERPENVFGITKIYDENVKGLVYCEPHYPNIKYFIDGNVYCLTDGNRKLKTLVIGGAYSVDKYYRLSRNHTWFESEQLTSQEKQIIKERAVDRSYDLVLSHTCPLSWQPTDLFIVGLDQSTVDNSMELWMDELKDLMNWDVWLFGHYHADRFVRPHVEMYYTSYEDLSKIIWRWHNEDEINYTLYELDPKFWED